MDRAPSPRTHESSSLQFFDEINQALASAPPIDAMDLICREVRERFNLALVTVYLFLPSRQRLRLVAANGYPIPKEHEIADADTGVIATTRRRRRPTLVADVTTEPDYLAGHPEVTSEYALPLLTGERVIGVLNTESFAAETYGPTVCESLERVATQLTLALRHLEFDAELRSANAAKSEFLASVSHELRTPLNGVIGLASVLANQKLGDEPRETLEALRGSAELLREMIDDLLDYSRDDQLNASEFEPEALPETADAPGSRSEERRSQPLRVLVADDNPVNQIVIRKLLQHLAIEPDLCENGLLALRAVERQGYDLILMDCQMPELDGYETTVRIRQRERAGEHVAIVGVTAYACEGDREKCLAAGMDDYLTKPVTVSDLEKVLKRWLGRNRIQ